MRDQRGTGSAGPRRRKGTGRRPVDPEALRAVSGRITALEEQRDPERRSLFVDGEFVLGLHLETILRCRLKVGQDVDGEALWQAYALDLEKQAWEAGLRLLAAAPRTRRELARRLGRTYPPETVERVVARLADAGWLDDRAFAANYVRSHPDFGARRLLADLARKGVDRAVAAAVVQEERGEEEAVEQARAVAAARLRRMGQVDRLTAGRRLAGYLARRGFGPEAVRAALEPLLRDLPAPAVPGRSGLRTAPRGAGWRRKPGAALYGGEESDA
ncbi:regulatory protein [Symbiobacterium terraclitae]|uniref:Regulatory protein RecX n=1 Tax=Symbiobacterium terraclitae TaxID=557451 RepID=A0ABS4JMW1_9FIRM|nr:regulatory protein RecX [Symbiobacterium terraclitae]MBP2016877.1 regulatory protein [Symbiobacterium terraclitae]